MALVEYVCANPEHRPPHDAPQPILRFEGGAAYCPLGADDGHDWRATGGKTLATVREWLDRPATAVRL
jgi:hypothetical protein